MGIYRPKFKLKASEKSQTGPILVLGKSTRNAFNKAKNHDEWRADNIGKYYVFFGNRLIEVSPTIQGLVPILKQYSGVRSSLEIMTLDEEQEIYVGNGFDVEAYFDYKGGPTLAFRNSTRTALLEAADHAVAVEDLEGKTFVLAADIVVAADDRPSAHLQTIANTIPSAKREILTLRDGVRWETILTIEDF